MYATFKYYHNGNPYISITNNDLFRMLCKYDYEQIAETDFYVTGEKETENKTDYKTRKSLLRDIAIQWQNDFSKFSYSYFELSEWQDFFEEYGKKYGLLKEFKENAII